VRRSAPRPASPAGAERRRRGPRVEFIDSKGNSLWTFPNDRAISGLYKAVQFKTSNIEGFMKDFLKDEDDKNDLDHDTDAPY
jgi:hypothetical protein